MTNQNHTISRLGSFVTHHGHEQAPGIGSSSSNATRGSSRGPSPSAAASRASGGSPRRGGEDTPQKASGSPSQTGSREGPQRARFDDFGDVDVSSYREVAELLGCDEARVLGYVGLRG